MFAHEGLIRGPAGSSLHLPAALFRAANTAGIADELEFCAAEVIYNSYAHKPRAGLLFVNYSARAITQLGSDAGREPFRQTLLRCGIPARSLVTEITEHERVIDHQGLSHAIEFLRSIGVAIALDDFGDGSSSLRLWAELQPEYVKIDRYFCHGIHADGKKMQTVKAMLRLAEDFGSRVIAEGVEDATGPPRYPTMVFRCRCRPCWAVATLPSSRNCAAPSNTPRRPNGCASRPRGSTLPAPTRNCSSCCSCTRRSTA